MSAFDQGFEMGRQWEGPNGDGSLGSLSLDFVQEQAERCAAGFRFSELDYVTDQELADAESFMRGFYSGLAACSQEA